MLFDNSEPVYILFNSRTNPEFNLACEEYFLCRREENFIMLWRNEPSIIIGRNQNAYAELDVDYVAANNIPVIRRLTGGGAVFHDLGNLNFTFIKNGCDGMADFKEYLQPVTAYLRSLGLNADFSGRNDILLDGMKISGNAQTNFKGRVMLHGTLLFSVAMGTLAKALKPNPLKLEAKGIKSVKSRVTNISEHLKEKLSIDEFCSGLFSFLKIGESGLPYELTNADIQEINRLVERKYGTFLWNIGSAPPCMFERSLHLESGIVTANFSVKNEHIEVLRLTGDFFSDKPVQELEAAFDGAVYDPQEIEKILSEVQVGDFIHGMTIGNMIKLLFG